MGKEWLCSALLSAVVSSGGHQCPTRAGVRKLGGNNLEKGTWVSTTLLALGAGRQGGRQDNKLESLACLFAKPGGHKLTQTKIQHS